MVIQRHCFQLKLAGRQQATVVVEFAAGGQLQFFAGRHHRISGGDIAGRGADHDPCPRGSTVIKIHRPALGRQRSCRHIAAIQRQRALAIQRQRAAAGARTIAI